MGDHSGTQGYTPSISNQHCARGPTYALRQAGIIVFTPNSNKNIQLPKNELTKKYKDLYRNS